MLKKCLLITIVGFILAFPALVLAEEVELAYDDGTPAARFRGGLYENIIYAVRFTPPSGEWLLKAVRYYFLTPGYPAKVRVFDSNNDRPGSDLFPGFNITPQSVGWYDVDLTDADIWVSDEFYVGLEMLSLEPTQNPGLGGDIQGNERSWNHVGNHWSLNEHTTYFIRAVVVDELGVEEELLPESSMDCRCYPNPFTASTQIDYVVPQAGPLTFSIWDAGGRCVRILVDACKPQGNHLIRWDGKDEAGNPLPSGVYFSRLDADYSTLTQRIVLIR